MSARILIVDDIQANLDVLEVKLQLNNYEVITANRGTKALDIARTQHPDLIILDVMMPDMDGFEVCAALKAQAETADIPVVILTALADREHKLKGLETGAEDFLSKPIQDRALLTRIKSLIRMKRTMDESLLRAELSEKISGAAPLHLQDIDVSQATVFLLSENRAETKNIIQALARDKFNVSAFTDFNACESQLSTTPPELILIDLHHEVEDSLKLISLLRGQENTRSLPILGLADDDHTETLIQALDVGLNDYVMRPLDPYEIYVRARGQIKRWRYHLKLLESHDEDVDSLDPLTQVYNRPYVMTHIKNLLHKTTAEDKFFSLMLIRWDHIKGQTTGDLILKDLAFRIKDSVRDFDLVSRFNDHEFLVILPDTDKNTASLIAERMHQKVTATGTYINIGITTSEKGLTFEGLMSKLDNSLDILKPERGNNVVSLK